jgi:hypothetical protein
MQPEVADDGTGGSPLSPKNLETAEPTLMEAGEILKLRYR